MNIHIPLTTDGLYGLAEYLARAISVAGRLRLHPTSYKSVLKKGPPIGNNYAAAAAIIEYVRLLVVLAIAPKSYAPKRPDINGAYQAARSACNACGLVIADFAEHAKSIIVANANPERK